MFGQGHVQTGGLIGAPLGPNWHPGRGSKVLFTILLQLCITVTIFYLVAVNYVDCMFGM